MGDPSLQVLPIDSALSAKNKSLDQRLQWPTIASAALPENVPLFAKNLKYEVAHDFVAFLLQTLLVGMHRQHGLPVHALHVTLRLHVAHEYWLPRSRRSNLVQ